MEEVSYGYNASYFMRRSINRDKDKGVRPSLKTCFLLKNKISIYILHEGKNKTAT